MFYQPGTTEHGLPYDPFKVRLVTLETTLPQSDNGQACVVPRPIGWISTTSSDGIHNLAPYSQFNNLTFDPPYVMFSANQTTTSARKDSVVNAETTGRFCWNLATWDLRNEVNISSEEVEPGVDEFERAGLEKVDSQVVSISLRGGAQGRVPMVKKSPVRFECEYYTTLRLPGNPPMGTVDVIIGKVVGVHVDDSVITDGKVDIRKTQPIARCGYYEYAVVKETFEMIMPGTNELIRSGMEGSARKNRDASQIAEVGINAT